MRKKIIVHDRVILLLSTIILISLYSYYFSGFLLNERYHIGDDYSYFLPSLLNGYFWFLANGITDVPWFTPAFCGGMPYFANPQVMYYSMPQFLSFIFDPVFSVFLTFIIFAMFGYIGFFMLLHKIFHTKIEVAVFGAALFLFNGFYLSRFILGHLTVHSFMLVPMLAYFLLRFSYSSNKRRSFDLISELLVIGLLLAYVFHSGAANYLIPFVLCVIGIWLIAEITGKANSRFWCRLLAGAVIAIVLSASKLVSALAFLEHFPRDFNLLPGIEGFWNTFLFVVQALFFSVSEESVDLIVNTSFPLESRALNFSITVIPLIVCLLVVLLKLKEIRLNFIRFKSSYAPRKLLAILSLLFLIFLPVFLNVYTPAWNDFLKEIPYIKNSSLLTRWIIINIPLFIVLSCLALNFISSNMLRVCICVLGVVFVVILNGNNAYSEHSNGHLNYDSRNIIRAYYQTKKGGVPPPIKSIGVQVDNKNRIVLTMGRNDSLGRGISQMFCYEPIFGYNVEKMPVKTLHPGSVLEQEGDYLNIKKPSCYLYGESNHCVPGDHYLIGEKEQVEKLISYKPVYFNKPIVQKIADWINAFSVFIIFVIVITVIFFKFLYIFSGVKTR